MNTLARTVAGLVATSALLIPSAAAHAGGAAAKPVSKKTSYSCTSAAGTSPAAVTVTATLPKSVKKGAKVKSKTASLTIVLSAATTATLRQYGVTSVKGYANKATLTAGANKIPLTTLNIPATPVPATGTMTLKATGKNKAFKIKKAGTYTVSVPASFGGQLTATLAGSPYPTPISCALVSGAPTKLSKLKVLG